MADLQHHHGSCRTLQQTAIDSACPLRILVNHTDAPAYIVQNCISIQAKAYSYWPNPLWPEGPFCVYVGNLQLDGQHDTHTHTQTQPQDRSQQNAMVYLPCLLHLPPLSAFVW